MCKVTNKCLFAAGLGMQMLVHFCATGFGQELTVVNGGERGGPITSIQEVPQKMGSNHVFLDNLTGDFYALEGVSWKPQGNVGLHYSRAMAALGGSGGELVKKVSTHHSKVTDLKPSLFFSKLTDVKCLVKKHYISHPLMYKMPQEFVVENRNTWDPHPVNITNLNLIEKYYDTMAESDRGPQVATHKNTVAIQFQVDHKYKETVQLLQNYINIRMSEI
jgi:hypothetical protein